MRIKSYKGTYRPSDKMSSHSPSHFNLQPWRFIIVEDENVIKRHSKDCRRSNDTSYG
ncbi:MAG: nitroreductase family protein [Ignavibacteria bacterium]|nr:nitroreductase family protein [Ignavibacteria bacterium]